MKTQTQILGSHEGLLEEWGPQSSLPSQLSWRLPKLMLPVTSSSELNYILFSPHDLKTISCFLLVESMPQTLHWLGRHGPIQTS